MPAIVIGPPDFRLTREALADSLLIAPPDRVAEENDFLFHILSVPSGYCFARAGKSAFTAGSSQPVLQEWAIPGNTM